MYTLRQIVELVSWLVVDSPEEQATDAIDQGTEAALYIEIDRGGCEFVRTSNLNAGFSFEWNFLPNANPDPMSEVIILCLYYEESSSLEGNDRFLLAKCNFIIGELLKACWLRDRVELHLKGKDEVCVKLVADLSISTKFRKDPQNLDMEIEHHRKALDLRATSHPERGVTLYNLADALRTRFIQRGNTIDNDAAIEYYRAAAQDIFAPSHPAVFLEKLASALHMRFNHSKNLEDINEAIGITEELLEARHADRDIHLINLARLLQVRFEHHPVGDSDDISKIIMLLREALALQDTAHPHRRMTLDKLASALHMRFKHSKNPKDINEAIGITEELLEAHHADRDMDLINLARLLQVRLEHHAVGDPDDIEKMIVLLGEALALQDTPHPHRSMALNDLGAALHARFHVRGDLNDLEDAVKFHREALAIIHPRSLTQTHKDPKDLDDLIELSREELQLTNQHPSRWKSLENLAGELEVRFDQRKDANDLDESIELRKEALQLYTFLDPNRSEILREVASSLRNRFEHRGNVSDLDDAITLCREDLVICAPSDLRPPLRNLADAIQLRFDRQRNPKDIDEAIQLYRRVLGHDSPSYIDETGTLNNLSAAVLYRFEQQGNPADLEEAIELGRKCLELGPVSQRKRIRFLVNLAMALRIRFNQHGDARDLDEGVELHRQALQSHATDDPDYSIMLNNLADVLQMRFRERGRRRDIDEAIGLYGEAIMKRPSHHQHRSIAIHNLGHALELRFRTGRDLDDINKAIDHHKQALELRMPPNPRRRSSLNSLATALVARFEHQHDPQDIDIAIELCQEALLNSCPDPHPDRVLHLRNLGNCVLHGVKLHKPRMDAIDVGISTSGKSSIGIWHKVSSVVESS
ncbi:hypothetical protein B0H19DRAFT_1080312 [Mycena capillaripes]|nr:hypothetical protein B0H19DRAFT_1080312 [Mycena capillaripes]